MKNKLVAVWNRDKILNNSDIWFSSNSGLEMGIKYSGGTESLRSFYYLCELDNYITTLHLK